MIRLYLIWAVLRGKAGVHDNTEFDTGYPFTWGVEIKVPAWYIKRIGWDYHYRSYWNGKQVVINLLER